MHFLDYDPDDIDVRVAELLMATHEGADPLLHPKVGEALNVLREHLGMDVVFVSQFQGGRRNFKVVDSRREFTKVQAGQSDPVEESWCHHIVTGRAPQLMKDARPFVENGTLPRPAFDIGTHISTPVILKNGEVYGTLCCFSADVKDGVSEMDLKRLQITAQILSDDLLSHGLGAELELQPLQDRYAPFQKKDFRKTDFQKTDFQATDKMPPDFPGTKR